MLVILERHAERSAAKSKHLYRFVGCRSQVILARGILPKFQRRYKSCHLYLLILVDHEGLRHQSYRYRHSTMSLYDLIVSTGIFSCLSRVINCFRKSESDASISLFRSGYISAFSTSSHNCDKPLCKANRYKTVQVYFWSMWLSVLKYE